MKQERWQQIEGLYQAALERGPETRATFLREACPDDSDLRRKVETLLAYASQPNSFIERPAIEFVARELAADAAGRSSFHESSESLPTHIGPYKLVRQLGRGGMGEVHLALDTRLNRRVAIKFLPAEITADRERTRRFEQEARAVSALNHPNIITIYEIGEFENRHYIVTEYEIG